MMNAICMEKLNVKKTDLADLAVGLKGVFVAFSISHNLFISRKQG